MDQNEDRLLVCKEWKGAQVQQVENDIKRQRPQNELLIYRQGKIGSRFTDTVG